MPPETAPKVPTAAPKTPRRAANTTRTTPPPTRPRLQHHPHPHPRPHPESWYSWRHQLPALAAAGCRAVAVEVRGYGRSSRPVAVDAYRMLELVADNVAVVEALGEGVRSGRRARLGRHHRPPPPP